MADLPADTDQRQDTELAKVRDHVDLLLIELASHSDRSPPKSPHSGNASPPVKAKSPS